MPTLQGQLILLRYRCLFASLLTTVSIGWVPFVTVSFSSTRSALIPGTLHKMAPSEVEANPLEALGLPSPLLLGSASFSRKYVLTEMKVPYHVLVRPIDEKTLGDRSKDPPDVLVATLGKAKADHLLREMRAGRCDRDLPEGTNWREGAGRIVLTGDQVVTCNGQILEKPESVQEAKTFVSQYPTHPPSTVGSCVLTHVPSGIQVSGIDTATVIFKKDFFGEALVDELLAAGEPILSCAGGLMVEHPKVKANIERIDGTEDSVMGLSKDLVLKLLHEMSQELKKANLLS